MLTPRKKVIVAALGSALLHVALLFVAGFIVGLTPSPPAEPPRATEEPLHVEIVQSEPVPTAAPTPAPPRVLDNSEMKEAENTPANPKFQGDRTTVAASEGPATGDKPLPSQTGRPAPNYVFNPAPPVPEAPTAATPAPPEPLTTTPPAPAPTSATAAEPVKEPAPTRVRNELAMLDTAPTPPPEEVNPYDPSFRSTAPPPPTPVRAQRQRPAYHPMEERTASTGDITNFGASSVDAVATPYGRYRKRVIDVIKVVWIQSLQAHSDVAALGTVTVHFAIDRSGHVHTPRLISNSSNEALASITFDALAQAPIPPIPPDVVQTMTEAMLQLDMSFVAL